MLSLLIFAIILFVALAIDSSRFSSSKREARMSARTIALGALEAYMSAPNNLSEAEKLNIALERARILSGNNKIIGLPGESALQIDLATNSLPSGRTTPVLIPGKYFFTLNPDKTNPCEGGKSPPCYRPLKSGEKPNSMRIEGQLYKDVGSIFSTTTISTKLKPYSNITATLLPRRGCFLVDISASMAYDTHPRESNPRKRFAYYLDGPGGQIGDEKHKSSFSNLPSLRNSNPWTPTTHYQSDYKTYQMLSDEDYGANEEKYHPDPRVEKSPYKSPPREPGRPYYYTVDSYYESNYSGPQPLATVFKGLDGAIKKFKERKVGGDKACIIFYDDKLLWHRIFNLTDDFDYLEKFTDLSDRTSTDKGFQFAMKHGAFPRVGSQTNTGLALEEASIQFDANRGLAIPTSDFIVLIGDGLSNCRNCQAQDNKNGNYCGSVGPGCSNRFDYYYYSALESEKFAAEVLAKQKIPIHVVQVGQATGPHTKDIYKENSTTECMSEFEKRRDGKFIFKRTVEHLLPGQVEPQCPKSFPESGSSETSCDVNTNWSQLFKNANSSAPFYYSGRSLYQMATSTGGGWYPLRPQGSDCSICRPGSKRLTDPLCRPTATQLGDAITEIMNQSPFTIMEDN